MLENLHHRSKTNTNNRLVLEQNALLQNFSSLFKLK